MFIKHPFRISYPMVESGNDKTKQSIDAFLDMLIASNKFCCIADPDFGFALEDFRFESFSVERAKFFETVQNKLNPKENTQLFDIKNPLYDKKIIGDSRTSDTFATELKHTIERYEKRLKDVSVSMDFQSRGKIIHITVSGKINDETHAFYYYEFNTVVW
ncbi:MAG: hypothetical protein IJL64_04955 [Bacteroidales bacterium]|nr:hypothetical protein [Bacteroidales bacterium]MBQ7213547.1 hypothetical protein [Bacteroidales bacterium]MBR3286816.1 hypothetical protein [Bacteroidales bacterium]